MRVYWLSVVPLGIGVPLCMLRPFAAAAGQSKRRMWVVVLSLLTNLVCAGMALRLQREEVSVFLGQQWALSQTGQTLLAFLFLATALLIAIAGRTRQVEPFCGPALASLGLLSAVILLQSQQLSFVLLPAALVVLTLAVPAAPPSVRGASRFLALVTLPIPFMVACFALLDRLALFPDELALVDLGGLLVIPCVALWLTLFPFQGTTRLWAEGQVPLAPAFLWIAKDWVVVCLLLTFWTCYPALRTESTAAVLGILGLATSVVSGVWASVQSDPSAVLACAALSELGMVVQGLATNSSDSLQGALILLVGRSFAVLLATSALAVLAAPPGLPGAESPTRGGLPRWQTLLPLVAFSVGVLSLAGAPPLVGFLGRQHLYTAIRAQNPSVLWAWLPASFGLALGLIRSGWCMWHSARLSRARSIRNLPAPFAMCLLLLCFLWFGLHPQPILRLILDVAAPWMPPSAL